MIYAKSCRTAGARSGASLGFLFGVFMAGAFVAVNYATLNISGKLASELAISKLVEWTQNKATKAASESRTTLLILRCDWLLVFSVLR
jgi:hypothetical protein